jgi:ppGpp synthetase/RelA/SpoT-type nucleotidyltranferase
MVSRRRQPTIPFGFDGFQAWYADHCRALLEPARQTFVRLLEEQLRQGVSELDRHRVRVSDSRVKEPLRVWSKLQKPQYRSQAKAPADVPALIDDLVGVRIVCNNLSDIATVQAMLADLPGSDGLPGFGMAAEQGSEKRYVDAPKDSGYRAFHVNLVTQVPGLSGLTPVRGELQVRTLLQDGWGELTHEDTYKPGVQLPPLVTTLARRMADLLATVDDLAQDLRLELDRLAQSAVEDAVEAPSASEEAIADQPASAPDAAGEASPALVMAETARIVSELTQPASLASIAALLQGLFGTALRDGWAGHGSFKALLVAAVPGVQIVKVGPGYVVPPGAQPSPEWPRALRDGLP